MVITSLDNMLRTGVFPLSVRNVNKTNSEETEIDINNLIAKEEQKLRRIKEAFEDGIYTLEEYKESKQAIDSQIEMLKKKFIKPQNSEKQLRKKLIEKYKNVPTQLRNNKLSEAEKNDLLRSFVDKIVFNRENTSIQIYFCT